MYEKSITRENRTSFVILIDQSGSMVEVVEYGGVKISKAKAVALVTNQILSELIERAKRYDGVRDYYDIAVVGYSGAGVKSMLSSGESPFISVSDLSKMEVPMVEFKSTYIKPTGEEVEITSSIPEWVAPLHTGDTPMFEALSFIYTSMKEWCSRPENHNSFPPVIINITDGESSDCSNEDFINMSRKLRSLSTSDGNVFVINIHLASTHEDSSSQSIIFPTLEEVKMLNHRKAEVLAQASSVMPSVYNELICEVKQINTRSNFVAMSYNCSIAELITILNIGTISVKKA